MFGKRKSKVKPEAAVGVSIKRTYEYSEFVYRPIPRIVLPDSEPEQEAQPKQSPEASKQNHSKPVQLESELPEQQRSELLEKSKSGSSQPEPLELSKPEQPSGSSKSEQSIPTQDASDANIQKEIVSSIQYPPKAESVPSSPSLDKIKNSRFRVQSASFTSEIKETKKVESTADSCDKSSNHSNDDQKEQSRYNHPDTDNNDDPPVTHVNHQSDTAENDKTDKDKYDQRSMNSNSTTDENHEEETEPPLNRIMRRKSVFAEAYNPEEEEDESEIIIHAKSDEQRIRLGENVKNIFLFRSLDHDQIGEVLDAMFERRVKEDEYVIKQGDDGDNFYVIESGTYNIFVDVDPSAPPKLVGKYENSGSFGELALMYNLPRAATIQAITPGSLWAMDRQTFRRIVLNAAYKKRKMYESLLEKVPMLKALQNYERMNLADALIPRIKFAGELIIKQGDAADGMYFVEEGSARVVMVNSDNQEKEISRVNVGGYFGELALVTKKPRAASVFAVDKVRLAFLDVEAFERLLGPCMDIMKRNIEDYENELLRIFGSQANISDIR